MGKCDSVSNENHIIFSPNLYVVYVYKNNRNSYNYLLENGRRIFWKQNIGYLTHAQIQINQSIYS